jgi:hypothetical protein
VLLACAFFAIVRTQDRLTSIKTSEWFESRLTYLPESDVVEPFLLGFGTTFANYLWIKTILYFGTHYITDRGFPWLVHMVDMVTRLNPLFYPAYEFAGLILPDLCNDPGAGRVILERGIGVFGRTRWELWFYAGMIQYAAYDDFVRAAQYFVNASRIPGTHSRKLASLAVGFLRQTSREDQAHEVLSLVYETVEDPSVKRRIAEKLAAE